MGYIEGTNREQLVLFPETLDEYITENNIVRFVDAFVEQLNFYELGFKYAQTADTGRKPYNPSDMLKLYIYSYLKKIRSSRRIDS
jgi:transposase